jgi:hypothetical protein
MNFAPLYGAIAATAAIRRTSEERRKYEEGFASRRHQAIERFEQLEDEAGQSVDELRTKQQDIEARLNEIFPPIKTDNQQHPIAPPPELVAQWQDEWNAFALGARYPGATDTASYVAIRAAQWGADQELEACCEWIADWYGHGCNEVIGNLRTDRRPKPPSLKDQALTALHAVATGANDTREQHQDLDTIRRALEALPE